MWVGECQIRKEKCMTGFKGKIETVSGSFPLFVSLILYSGTTALKVIDA